MSIYSAMRAGVTGLNANATALSLISDNIANLNTTAYKRGEASFSAILNAQNGASAYSAGGVASNIRRFVDLQGSMEQTSSALDLAINGAGFFIVTRDASSSGGAGGGLFTRAGSFSLDAQGKVRNAQGYFLMGAPIGSASSNLTPSSLAALEPIKLSNIGSTASPTAKASMNANLDSRLAPYASLPGYIAGAMAAYPGGTDSIAPQVERSMEIYDSLGAARTLTIGFLKTDANTWKAEIYMRPAGDVTGMDGLLAAGEITFSTSGVATTVDASLETCTITYAPELGAADQVLSLNLTTNLTQFAAASALNAATADGSPPGTLIGVSVSQDGILTARYSNGRSEPLFLVPIATFLNASALLAENGGAYRATLGSGQFTINAAGSGGAGPIQARALENSNVDLGIEFTSMIIVQRAYSACSKIVTTANDMLEDLLRIKR